MFIIRNVLPRDLGDLKELSEFHLLINLPREEKKIKELIDCSVASFQAQDNFFFDRTYVFVLEDTVKKKVIGVSMINAQHGTKDEPHFYLDVSQENKYSKTLNTGFIHGTLKLGIDTNGPTEIGGLVLHPDYRKNTHRLGKQISFARFLYISLHRNKFKNTLHSELLPPFDDKGNSVLWEAVGRQFLNMNYHEADLLSRENSEFILSLFPSENIYQCLLPVQARKSIGEVGNETKPVQKMLESIGFKYNNQVDPFDGGPHYQCEVSEVLPIKNKISGKITFAKPTHPKPYLLEVSSSKFDFQCLYCQLEYVDGQFLLGSDHGHLLQEGSVATAIPLNF